MPPISRRDLLRHAPVAGGLALLGPTILPRLAHAQSGDASESKEMVPPSFPRRDPELVQRVVGLCHRDLDAVRVLVEARPTLAKAAIDWGFGDWETALGAASHVGRPDIADFLMSHGARPDHFTFAMLGNLSALRAMIEAQPDLPGIHGPHGITLLQHAKNGGATDVVEYLESRGDADPRYRDDPIADEDKASMLGEYAFGDGAADVLVVGEAMGGLAISRRGGVARRLFHQGEFAFHPAGATAVRVRFERTGGAWTRVHVVDEAILVTGTRIVG